MSSQKRRSDRLMLTVPLWVMGSHPKDFPFIEDARTIILNRHGALIQIFRPLPTGQSVLVVNLVTQRKADFRVVGPVAPFTEKGGEYGIEYLQGEENIWDIQFPAPPEDDAGAKALLECRQCHSVGLLRVSLIEVEVLETAGILSKPCQTCKTDSPWGHPEKKVAMGGPPEEAEMFAAAQARAARKDPRRDPRGTLQLPVLIRDFEGIAEVARSENASSGGFCFSSGKDYPVGQGVIVACPYNASGENFERSARIVRRSEIEGTSRTVYGVRYESPPSHPKFSEAT